MSRFEEVVNEAIGEVVLGESTFKAETLAEHIAQLVRERQGARRAEVSVEARFPEHKPAPVSGIQTQEMYTLHGSAICTELGTRRLIGVTAQGITACPCAQELVAQSSRERLQADGFTPEEIDRILQAVPVATHNQRGLGTLHIGCTELCDDEIDAEHAAGDRRGLDVLGDLRADEALRRSAGRGEGAPPPALRRGLRAGDDPRRDRGLPRPRRSRVRLRAQVNLETIHQHNVVAERFGTLGEVRHEYLDGRAVSGSHEPARLARRDAVAGTTRRRSSPRPTAR